jgi:hypothetical protein
MTIYDEIKGHLETITSARERKNKNNFIAWLLWNKHNVSKGIDKAGLKNLIIDASTYDRAWRQVLQKNSNLRGSDYEEKESLEENKQTELGY